MLCTGHPTAPEGLSWSFSLLDEPAAAVSALCSRLEINACFQALPQLVHPVEAQCPWGCYYGMAALRETGKGRSPPHIHTHTHMHMCTILGALHAMGLGVLT